MGQEHYLKRELYGLVKRDDTVFEFLQHGSLDGLWYWDLEEREHEWLSPRFWELFGYDSSEKRHLVSEWQDLIFPEDLEMVIQNFEQHCADPNHPYNQVVRYRHRDGSTVWVRCRGIAIRDEKGKPIRLLGAHTDVTELKRTEGELRVRTQQLEAANAALNEAFRELQRSQGLEEKNRELEEKNRQLEEFNRLSVDRELRMIELKREVNELAAALSRSPPYDVGFASQEEIRGGAGREGGPP